MDARTIEVVRTIVASEIGTEIIAMIAVTVEVEATTIEIDDDLKPHLSHSGYHPIDTAKLRPLPAYKLLLRDNSSMDLPHAIKVVFSGAEETIDPAFSNIIITCIDIIAEELAEKLHSISTSLVECT